MLLDDLQAAKFRGAPFLVPSDETEEGRNAICHEYPDASFRYVEDNGRIPPKFTLSAVLAEPGLPAKLNRLRSALNAPGPGVLKHPHYGTQFVQVDGTYRVKREDRQAGVIELEIKFAVTGAPILPGLVSGVAALVTGLAATAVTSMFTAFTKSYGNPSGAVTLATVSSAVASVASQMNASFGQASDAPSRIMTSAGLFARSGARLGPLLISSFRDPFDDDAMSSRALIKGFRAVSVIGSDISDDAAAITPSTADLSIRSSCLAILGASIEAAAFACIADAMAGHDYTTADEVEADEDLLTEAFEQAQARELDDSVHSALAQIHTAASEVLRDVAVRLPRISTMSIEPIPASVLAYQLYEDDSDVMTIVDLNLDKDPVLMASPVIVLSQDI